MSCYTNIDDIEIKEDIGRGYVVMHISERKKTYELVELPSVHRKRHRERTRLSSLFTRLFLEESKAYKLAEKINIKSQRIQPAFISDWKTENIDSIAGKNISANFKIDRASDTDLQRLFDYFVQKNLAPFHHEDRSVGRMKESIYQFFYKQLGMVKWDHFREMISITLSEDNRIHFEAVIDAAKRTYILATEKLEKELVSEIWEVPERLTFVEGYIETSMRESIMEPFYSNERWRSEKAFIDFLERQNNKVAWWFKNGDRDATFFAVPYKIGDNLAPFYVDFIVMMKDGRIGLFDPHGVHLADFSSKSRGLQEYIAHLNKEGRKVFGGIVGNTDPRHLKGQWMVYRDTKKPVQENDWNGWARLDV